MAVLLDMFRQKYKGLKKKWKMEVADIMLSFRHDVGFLTIGDLKKPDSCCCIGISLVCNNYIEMLYMANEGLSAVITLIDMKNGK
jgi:hypothetical protein